MRCNQRKRCHLIESLYLGYILVKSKSWCISIRHGFGCMSRYIFQAIVAKSHDAKLVILNLPGPPKVVGADKDCSCKTSSSSSSLSSSSPSSSSSSPSLLPILVGLIKVWKLLIPKCESRNDLLHHHVPGWTNIVKCQHTLWQLKRFQFKGLSPNFHMATIQNIHKILEIAAQKVSTTMISLDIEFLEVLTKEIFEIFGNILWISLNLTLSSPQTYFVNIFKSYFANSSDMEFLEVLTEGLERVLMVRGGGREVITIYS